jgi:hypothetical protein
LSVADRSTSLVAGRSGTQRAHGDLSVVRRTAWRYTMPMMKRIPSPGYQEDDAKEQDNASGSVAERQARQANPY